MHIPCQFEIGIIACDLHMDQELYIKEINGIKKNIINHPLFRMKFNKKQLSVFYEYSYLRSLEFYEYC